MAGFNLITEDPVRAALKSFGGRWESFARSWMVSDGKESEGRSLVAKLRGRLHKVQPRRPWFHFPQRAIPTHARVPEIDRGGESAELPVRGWQT